MRSLPPYEDDVKEVLNYVRALEYGLATIAAAPRRGPHRSRVHSARCTPG
jgi:plasmid stabilization system protein ParE